MCFSNVTVSPGSGKTAGASESGGGANAEMRDPGAPALVFQPQWGIGICGGGFDTVCEFSTASRVPHSM